MNPIWWKFRILWMVGMPSWIFRNFQKWKMLNRFRFSHITNPKCRQGKFGVTNPISWAKFWKISRIVGVPSRIFRDLKKMLTGCRFSHTKNLNPRPKPELKPTRSRLERFLNLLLSPLSLSLRDQCDLLYIWRRILNQRSWIIVELL